MAGTGSGSSPSVPSVRAWRTAFLTLRDETLTLPPRSSVAQMLHNLIFSHAHALTSAVPEIPSHEILSDILFLLELVATTSTDEEELIHVFMQTSRLIHDISRRVYLEINFLSLTRLLNCLGKMLDIFLGLADVELIAIGSTARISPAIECLQAIRCIINSSHRRWAQSEDILLVKFLLNVIGRTHAVSCSMRHSTCKETVLAEISVRLSRDSSPWELQGIVFSMLGEAISRDGSLFPVDIWRSMIEVVRKTMDGLASNSSILEDNVMSRFYESFLHCLHLALIDPKCSVSDHVSVFVSVLRMFFTYGLTSRMPHTSLPFGCDKKQLSIASPAVSLGQGNKPDRSAYRPPHLRKRDCSNLKHNRIHHSQCLVEDNDSSTAIVTSSDSDFSDSDGPAKECDSVLNSRVRVAAVICVQDLCQADSTSFSMQWSILLPTTDVLQPRKCDATLMTCLLFDPYLKGTSLPRELKSFSMDNVLK